MNGRQKLYFLLDRIDDVRETTPRGEPIRIHPVQHLNRKYYQEELINLLNILEKDEGVIRIIEMPNPKEGYLLNEHGYFVFELLEGFKNYYSNIQNEQAYQDFTGKKPPIQESIKRFLKQNETVIRKPIFGGRTFSPKSKEIADGFSPENYNFVLMVLKQVASLAEFSSNGEVYYRLQSPPGQDIIRERSLLQKFEKQGLWKNPEEDGLGTATLDNVDLSLIREIIGRIEEKQSGVISSEEFDNIKHEQKHPEFSDKKPTPISNEEKDIDDWLSSKDHRTLSRFSRVVKALNYEWGMRDMDTFRIPHDKFERQKITNTNDLEAILTTFHNKKFIFVSRKIAEQPPSNDPNKPGGMQIWKVITEDPSMIRQSDTQIKIFPKRFIYLRDNLNNRPNEKEENEQKIETETETIEKQISELAVHPTVVPPIYYGPSIASLNENTAPQNDTKSELLDVKSQAKKPINNIDDGTKWEDVSIQFMNGQEVIIKIKNKIWKHTTCEEMGFINKKNSQPNKQWQFLQLLSLQHGELSWENNRKLSLPRKEMDTFKKKKQRLAESLQTYFGIQGDPFYEYKKEGSYKIKMRLIPEQESIPNPQSDNLGIDEYIKEQSPNVYEKEPSDVTEKF